ncbi:hypothetical protein F443_02293 [Phytophthora nicotianae P1569]|uniref:Uncharacterized protein n=2 Tax=Phytophthora nicotianae TaxID=4792 RepID=V9FU02_PHYNI|nr:hypothetical protein F443_02293 [Phytophthora nicotianae P1569]ETO83724.1 hypothetical protein F444_02292 [Phytophthora nicotianae P1976]
MHDSIVHCSSTWRRRSSAVLRSRGLLPHFCFMDGASSTKQFLVDTKEVPNLLHCPASRFVSIGASQYLETACSRGGSSHLVRWLVSMAISG